MEVLAGPTQSHGTGASNGSEERRQLDRGLELPLRGDKLAARWAIGGVVVYVLLAGALLATMLMRAGIPTGQPVPASDQSAATTTPANPQPSTPGAQASAGQSTGQARGQMLRRIGIDGSNPMLTLLVAGGFVLTLVAILFVFFSDVKQMRPEEDDIDWVHSEGRSRLMLVFVSPTERAKAINGDVNPPSHMGHAVETLIDDRVRRIRRASLDGEVTGVSPVELRVIADARTERLGSFARYASSLLLLLAVLGTFAGVKTALPGLIDAFSSGVAGSTASLADPLRAVSDAFGANAFALIGAIAVGLMANGVAQGRRNMLERLELVSAEHIYRDELSQANSPVEAAMVALNRSAQELHESSGALLGIQSGLDLLSEEFRRGLETLEQHLIEVASTHEAELFDRNSRAMEELQNRVADLTDSVSANAKIYAGLVDAVGERSAESREAIEQLRKANGLLSTSLGRLGEAGETTGATAKEIARLISELSGLVQPVQGQIAQLSDSVASVGTAMSPILETARASIQEAVALHAGAEDRHERLLRDIRSELSEGLMRLAEATRTASPQEHDPRRMTVLLERIAVATEHSTSDNSIADHRTSTSYKVLLALLPTLGVIVGGGIVYILLRT